MPQSKKASMASRADRISALPDAVLQNVLSFLHAKEAVRSCVLTRRWCHLWRSMPVLRVTGDRSVQESRKFMDHLIDLRGHCPLNACLFHFGGRFSKGDVSYVNLWIQYTLLCQVRVLNVALRGDPFWYWDYFPVAQQPLVSPNLTELKLHNLCLNDKFLDFSSCPALEDLNMTDCNIPADKISSSSLKRLSIENCCFSHVVTRTRICVPSLISLQLTAVTGKTPLLEDMPVLVTATVRFGTHCSDSNEYLGYWERQFCEDSLCECCSSDQYCDDFYCECCGYGNEDQSARCVLLKGLSAATNLKMIGDPRVFILRRDLRWCPTFSKLKSLLLNEGYLAATHHALIYILQHSPVLENLVIQLPKTNKNMPRRRASYNLQERSFASENLKIVEIACQEVDQRVNNIMKALSTYGIPLEKITICQTNETSECFNFVCTGFSSKQGEENLGC